MSERTKEDLQVLVSAAFRPGPLIAGSVAFLAPLMCVSIGRASSAEWLSVPVISGLTVWALTSVTSMDAQRFRYPPYARLWASIQDRLKRLDRAYRRSPKVVKENLSGTPESVRRIADSMYLALRRADRVRRLIAEDEPKDIPSALSAEQYGATDTKARDLYGIAQKNREEYDQQHRKLMGGVERTEAQAAVLLSSLDSLRLKMLGYRVTGGVVEMPESELLPQLQEYKNEFEALQKAVDEVESEFLYTR